MLSGVNMQTVTIDTREPARIIRQIHEHDMLGTWRQLGGLELRSWLVGDRLTIGAEDGPNTATIVANDETLRIEHETDAEGWFVRAAIELAARAGGGAGGVGRFV